MSMSNREFQYLIRNSYCKVARGDAPKAKGQPRVNSRKIKFDGIIFDSKAEFEVYREYNFDPDIEILEIHPKFILQEGFKRNGKNHRAIEYTADFLIKEGGQKIVVEIKSLGTLKANAKSYPMRRKMFLKLFPNLRFREIIINRKKRKITEY